MVSYFFYAILDRLRAFKAFKNVFIKPFSLSLFLVKNIKEQPGSHGRIHGQTGTRTSGYNDGYYMDKRIHAQVGTDKLARINGHEQLGTGKLARTNMYTGKQVH